jgi:hypothetical protein
VIYQEGAARLRIGTPLSLALTNANNDKTNSDANALKLLVVSCKFQTNLAGPEELRMELAGLGSIRPYALWCYMSKEDIAHTHHIRFGAMRWLLLLSHDIMNIGFI